MKIVRRVPSTQNKKNKNKTVQRYYTKADIFLSRIASILKVPKGTVKNLFSERSVTAIRINSVIGKPEEIYSILTKKGLKMTKVPWAPNAYIVNNRDKSDLGDTQEYAKGLFYIQNLSSMMPAVVLNPKQNEKILDMCAAPGSKTSQMAAMMNNLGTIIANDEDSWRAQKLKDVLTQFGVKNCEIKVMPGQSYGRTFNMHFDKILLDAPCSGEGQIYLKGINPLRFWSLKKVGAMSTIQKELIESAFGALKVGGKLLYSTCTLEPQENEAVIDHLLTKYKCAKLLDIDLINSPEFREYKKETKPALTQWDQYKYDDSISKCVRVYPGNRMEGFFIALITKTC
ncbi:MAG TPA: RsmB/NOP family class I SAM-dependent RNA methyltransferase [Candidatus Dojkabacteria bacterium]|nr:RsmB/NOP family class I SAM-dependent RNA methyltransferase [Candidatus Dojkabacteria bacterium]